VAPKEKPGSHRRDIDGLRAVAVLLVMLHHAGLGFHGGFVGVDVFFVISGYLITTILVRELDGGAFSFWQFWQRRLLRIMPALLTVVAITFAVAWRVLLPWDFLGFAKSVPAGLFGYGNIHFWRETGYFASAAQEKPLLHTWSLGVEEQFYLLIPLLLAWLHRSGQRARVPLVILALFTASLVASICLTGPRPAFSFFWLPTRAWELLAGCLLALAPKTWTSRLGGKGILAPLGLALILIPAILYRHSTTFPGLAAIPPVLGTVWIIAAGMGQGSWTNRMLGKGPLVGLGTISYSLYLVHWPPLALARYLEPEYPALEIRIAVFLLSFPAAYLLWRGVETPWRLRGADPGARWRAGLVLSTVLLLAGSALQVRKNKGYPDRFEAEKSRLMASKDMDFRWWLLNHLPEDLPGNLIRLGPEGERPEILLWGDSHAKVLLPGLESACARNCAGLLAAVHDGAPPVAGLLHGVERMGPDRFILYSDKVIESAARLGVRKVILAGYWEAYAEGRPETLRVRLLQTVDRLQKENINVFFVRDVPRFSIHPNKILACADNRLTPAMVSISHGEYVAQNPFQESLLQDLEERGVQILDPLPCLRGDPGQEYSLKDLDGIRYWDQNHLSRHGSRVVEPMFDRLFTTKTQVVGGNAIPFWEASVTTAAGR